VPLKKGLKMASNLETVLAKVLKKVNPSEKDEKKVLQLADNLVEKVKTAAKKNGVKARVRVEGSVAKDTWIRGEPDIDIFMQVPLSTPREAFETTCLNIAKEATEGSAQVERFAEHPYLEAIVNGTRVNIVPCYKAKLGEWVSATDRTPFHTDYVMPRLDERLRSEIRLLKRFMKGIGVYGAEIKVGGFSGYLCELLVLRYNSFVGVLKAATDLRETWLIDYEGYYKGRENELPKIFEEPLIVVDPVDKGRNVASAVRKARLIEFMAASREFLKNPSLEFFYPSKTKTLSKKQLLKEIKKRESTLVLVKFAQAKTVPDILWGQLYKTQRSLRKMLEQNDFHVIRDSAWSNEKDLSVLVFEVEHGKLPMVKKHLGPPLWKKAECGDFLRKHTASTETISGPYIEDDRWVVEIKRKHTNIVELLRDKLKDGGRQVGVAELISQAVKKTLEIKVNEQIMKVYSSDSEFAIFLTDYLKGRPRWFRRAHAVKV
jgi:tRNA nucleotidyltransferase (CCA-adding enzyme)